MTTVQVNVYAYLDATWTDITSDISAGGSISAEGGMNGNKPLDLLAQVGQLNFSLLNNTGRYTPSGTSVISADWGKGTKVKVVFTYNSITYVRFYGTVDSIRIDAGTLGTRQVHVTALDWMKRAIEYPIQNPAVALNQRSDQAITTLLAGMPIQPLAIDFDTGANIFPTVFNDATLKTRAYSEFQKIALSELAPIYLKKDATYGETLRVESANTRTAASPVKRISITNTPGYILQENGDRILQENGDGILTEGYTLQDVFIDNTMTNMDVIYGQNLINRITVSANPTRIATVDTPIFKLDSALFVGAGEEKSFFVQFTEDASKRLVAALAPDPSYPTTLLHFDVAGTEELIVDESGKPWDDYDAQLITTVKKFGPSALYLDGTASYIEATASDDYELGDGDFLIEYWEYRYSATAGCATISRSGAGGFVPWTLGYSDGTNALIYISSNGASWDIANGRTFGAIPLNAWTHYALGRTDDTFFALKNGTLTDTWISSGTIPASTAALTIGKSGSNYITAAIDEVRIVKGNNPYTASFTVPTEPYQLSGVVFGAWTNANGTGTELTGDFTIAISYGAAGAEVTVTNTGTTSGYLSTLKINGKIVETISPVTDVQEDQDSIELYDYSELAIDQKYQHDFTSGREKAAAILDENKTPLVEINKVYWNANRDEAHMMYFLDTDIGDVVYIKEDQTEINGAYYIQGMGWDARSGNDGAIVTPWWIVKKLRDRISQLGIRFADLATNINYVDFGYLPSVAVENVPNRIWSLWFNVAEMNQPAPFLRMDINDTGDSQGIVIGFYSTNRRIQFTGVSGTTVQTWRGVALANTPDTWFHVLLVYDSASTSNAPRLYVNGTSNTMTLNSTTTTTRTGEVGTRFKIGDGFQEASMKDIRIYNADQAGDAATLASLLYAEGAYGEDNKDGLLFRTFYAPILQLADYEGANLTEDMKLVDDIGFAVGTPKNEPLGEAV